MTEIDDWKSLITDIHKHSIKELSEWEEGFVESIEERLEDGRPLTARQSEILHRIWEKVM